MKLSNEAVQLLDVLFDVPSEEPDMNIVSHIVAGSERPIALLQETVRVLWLALERPAEFDELVAESE